MSSEQTGLINQIENIVNTANFYENSHELDRLMTLLMTLKGIWYRIFYPRNRILPPINNPMRYKNMDNFIQRFYIFYNDIEKLHSLNEFSLQIIDSLIVEVQSMEQYYNKIMDNSRNRKSVKRVDPNMKGGKKNIKKLSKNK